MRPIRIFVYADVDANLIDGSSIWLQSLVELLHTGDRNHITLLLKKTEQRDVVTGQLRRLQRLRIVDPQDLDPHKERLRPSDVPPALRELDRVERFDIVLVRGGDVARLLSRDPEFKGRLWVYYLPPASGTQTQIDVADLNGFVSSCRYVLCQTEQIRALLEGTAPDLSRKLALLPPMIPDVEQEARSPGSAPGSKNDDSDRVVRMVYVGKFSPSYRFLEMVQLFRQLRDEISNVELHVAGDKIHNPSGDQVFESQVRDALRNTPGLTWHGGMSRAEVQRLLASADIALSIRDASMDSSGELSTKVLEYGVRDIPVVLNRTPLYEDLLGVDYPLFVDVPEDGLSVIRNALSNRELLQQAAAACHKASQPFQLHQVYETLRPLIERAAPEHRLSKIRDRPLRILVAGHDMKFFRPIGEHLQLTGAIVAEDLWRGHDSHDEVKSKELMEWADVIICEWCLGNAVWYSRNKRADQVLLVRLHRVEMESKYPPKVNVSNVDRVIFVSPHLERMAADRLGWPTEKLLVIPNSVDIEALHRSKIPGNQFNLGMLGYVPRLKRPDYAVDILELLRARDRRFHLYLKGHTPWDLRWVWKRKNERTYYESLIRRIASSPNLANAVSFEPFAADVPAWFQKVGTLLSTSDIEGNQVAVAEAMASGAMPVVLDRPGATDLYPSEFIFDSVDVAAEAISTTVEHGQLALQGQRAHDLAKASFSTGDTMREWERAINGVMENQVRLVENVDSSVDSR